MKDLVIRLETPNDFEKTETLIRDSFWNVYRPGASEHYVFHKMRKDAGFIPALDFVMEKDGALIGQAVCYPATVREDNGAALPVLTLGPICISPALQKQGYGKTLLDHALQKATELGYGAVLLEGDVGFYGKSGFGFASEYGIRYHGLPAEADASFFLAKELKKNYLQSALGEYETPAVYFVSDEDVDAFDKRFPQKKKEKREGQLF